MAGQQTVTLPTSLTGPETRDASTNGELQIISMYVCTIFQIATEKVLTYNFLDQMHT